MGAGDLQAHHCGENRNGPHSLVPQLPSSSEHTPLQQDKVSLLTNHMLTFSSSKLLAEDKVQAQNFGAVDSPTGKSRLVTLRSCGLSDGCCVS